MVTKEEMIEDAGIDDLNEAIAFSEYVELLYPPDILGGRWTTARAVEAVAGWRLCQLLAEPEKPRPRRESRLRVVWHRDGF